MVSAIIVKLKCVRSWRYQMSSGFTLSSKQWYHNHCAYSNINLLVPMWINFTNVYLQFDLDKDSTPKVNEILFIDNLEVDFHLSTMTWRYPQPRMIADISVMPLPFHLKYDARKELLKSHKGKVRCLILTLEYHLNVSILFFGGGGRKTEQGCRRFSSNISTLY